MIFRKAEAFVPRLTFSPAVQDRVRTEYSGAQTILEYGSGGSTALAASLGKRVFSVESDRRWALQMQAYLDANYPAAPIVVHHVDIGRTKSWGRPVTDKRMADFHHYPLSVWDLPDFLQPDLILIDGRFRVACLCTALMKIDRPTRVLFDDFKNRLDYQIIERLLRPAEMIENMAVFDLVPGVLPREHLTWMVGSYVQSR
jgi:hypothetical protein